MKITWEINPDYQGPQTLNIHVQDMLFECDTVEECMEYIQEEIDDIMLDNVTYSIFNKAAVKQIIKEEIQNDQEREPNNLEDYACASCGEVLDNPDDLLCEDCALHE